MRGSDRHSRWLGAAALVVLVALVAWGPQGWRATWRLRSTPGITSPSVAPWVRHAVACLERFGVTDFRVAGTLRTDYSSYQPLVVAAWPIAVSDRSAVVIVDAAEVAALPCQPAVLCRGEGAVVARCAP